MRLQQLIFMGAVAVAFVIGCIKASRKMIGGIIGGVIGLVVPMSFAAIYVRRGGDPTAVGAFSFFGLFTIPLGIIIGVAVASQTPKSTSPPDEDEIQCLGCGATVHREDKACPICGWSWK